MNEHSRKKKFLNLPKYPGGSQAFREFIAGNLRYPEAALEANVEGSVIVGYEILDDGTVINPHIIKSLGYGCDEEALRIIGLLQFEKVKNRGLRVKTSTKTKINFGLPKPATLQIAYTPAEANPKPAAPEKSSGKSTYEYTIRFE